MLAPRCRAKLSPRTKLVHRLSHNNVGTLNADDLVVTFAATHVSSHLRLVRP
jgi:hypothetical protein